MNELLYILAKLNHAQANKTDKIDFYTKEYARVKHELTKGL